MQSGIYCIAPKPWISALYPTISVAPNLYFVFSCLCIFIFQRKNTMILSLLFSDDLRLTPSNRSDLLPPRHVISLYQCAVFPPARRWTSPHLAHQLRCSVTSPLGHKHVLTFTLNSPPPCAHLLQAISLRLCANLVPNKRVMGEAG